MVATALEINTKVIPGYAGREGEMAMLRGEVDGTNGAYTGLLPFIKAKECRVILQIGAKKHKDLPDVPLASELKVSPKGEVLLKLIVAINELGRFTAAPPNVPTGKLVVFREAYKKALTDSELLTEGDKMGLDIDPAFGEEVARMMEGAIRQPEENIALLEKIIKIEE